MDIDRVPSGRLVYFHNHGDPGPGIYLPEAWILNRARFAPQGVVLESEDEASTLEPLLAEGLYRVAEEITCCGRRCRTYPVDTLAQLGYNATAEPILFVPEWTPAGLSFPEIGQKITEDRLFKLVRLKVAESRDGPGDVLH